MKKQIILQENIFKKIVKKFYLLLILLFLCSYIQANEKWIIDKNLSEITFEVPVLFATNVSGEFTNFDGFVEIDVKNKKNNKAILSVEIDSLEINYKRYKDLILGPKFFDFSNYPIGVLDTKKFSYQNEENLKLDIELTIKGISKIVETDLVVNRLAADIVQIVGKLEFNRNDFEIGTGNWKNTSILKNKIKINSSIFLFKE